MTCIRVWSALTGIFIVALMVLVMVGWPYFVRMVTEYAVGYL